MSSPFTLKLGTNYSPKDEEIAEIKALLIEPSLRLKSLNDEIADLQRAIEKLEEQRDGLDAHIEAHTALISPLRRMPPDMIQEIFMACLPTHRNCVMSAKEAPVLLGRICSSWRTLSLSTPRLWSRLHIVEPTLIHPDASKAFEEKLAQRLEITKTWLGRSGQCPLSISFQCAYTRDKSLSNSQDFMQAILLFASRWKNIEFGISPLLLATTAHLTEADVPTLNSLVIHHIDVRTSETFHWESLGLLRAPKLSRFSVSMASVDLLAFPLCWNQVTHFSISGTYANEGTPITTEIVLQVFAQCRQLRTCKMSVEDDFDSGHKTVGPIVRLSSLDTFDLTCLVDLPTTVDRLLAHLSLPILISAISNSQVYSRTTETSGLSTHLHPCDGFFTGLPHGLGKIHFRDFIYPSQGLLDVSHHNLLQLLPLGLREFKIDDCEAFSDVQVAASIISRASAGTLSRVTIAFSRRMEWDILPELRAFIVAGLHVELKYRRPVISTCSPWEGLDHP
ncbi:hypothetical protein B0H11DRAFT_2363514 [Mycena galericulata]|nr:hypothetical protein B0H11DRAFT_2363514 [Mycena galericulata]